MQKKFDTIIIGQGLAGSILAYRLIQGGLKVLVIDHDHHGSSSTVAAGIINPITGYRLITNVLFSEQRKIALELYNEFEKLFDERFVSQLKQFRLLKSDEQAKFWKKRQRHSTYKDYAGQTYPNHQPFIDNAWGVVEIHQTLRVHTTGLLLALKNWLLENNSYLSQKIDYQNIRVSDAKVSIDHIESRNIVFCEGYQVIHNPWWKHLPFKLSKGEILRVSLDKPINAMLNWRQWIVPDSIGGTEVLLGANYEWGDFSQPANLKPSTEARDYLLTRLESNTTLKANILEQHAGIRPTPTHRYPFVGSHQDLQNVYCFNGFGSKGCLSIPYYSEIFTQHLIDNSDLPLDITRWL